MTPDTHWPNSIHRFRQSEDGAALVEFALVLPMMLLVFAVIVEGARMMFAYQSAISFVRDATRYLARIVPTDICITGGSLSPYSNQVAIAKPNLGGVSLPGSVTIVSVYVPPNPLCVSGGYRVDPTPVVTVSATIAIAMPFSRMFTLNGGSPGTITTIISDSARVFGS